MSAARHRRRVNVQRRRRVALALLLLVTLTVIMVSRGHSTPSPTTVATTASTAAPTTTTTVPPFPSSISRTAVNVTEPATGHLAARSLYTVVRFPSIGGVPWRAHAPYPLVVFSHGFDVAPEVYAHLLNTWASAGYVVADPVYPFTTPNAPGGVIRTDIVNHPHDLSQVITSLLAASASRSGVLSGLINPTKIAVIGHSDGGDVALAAVANTCCRDPRVTAAILLSGAELSWFPGHYFTGPAVPMLVVQGSADFNLNPVTCSVTLYNEARQPKFYLAMLGQNHFSAYLVPGRATNVVTRATIDFLNAYLRDSPSALRAMIAAGSVPGLAVITNQARLAPVAGTCPDAPAG